MKTKKSTKRALLLSALSLIMCVSMLVGSTFAWFTDSVTSANNVIKSGNLDIKLEYWNGTEWDSVEGKSDILTNTLCSEELDLKEELVDFEDIIDTSLVHVDYEIRERGIDTYLVEFKYEVTLTMQCSITLNEVEYVISEEGSEIFSTSDEVEDVFLIEGQTLDTKEAILTNVLINKPMTVSTEGAEFISDEEPEEDIEEEKINPAFAGLKDLL